MSNEFLQKGGLATKAHSGHTGKLLKGIGKHNGLVGGAVLQELKDVVSYKSVGNNNFASEFEQTV